MLAVERAKYTKWYSSEDLLGFLKYSNCCRTSLEGKNYASRSILMKLWLMELPYKVPFSQVILQSRYRISCFWTSLLCPWVSKPLVES